MFIAVNPNPLQKSTGDFVIRAISILLDKSWDKVYTGLCVYGYMMKDWGSSNELWDKYLIDNGFSHQIFPNICPSCNTVKDFCNDYPKGLYLLTIGTYVVAIIDNNVLDSRDSHIENPFCFMKKLNRSTLK